MALIEEGSRAIACIFQVIITNRLSLSSNEDTSNWIFNSTTVLPSKVMMVMMMVAISANLATEFYYFYKYDTFKVKT